MCSCICTERCILARLTLHGWYAAAHTFTSNPIFSKWPMSESASSGHLCRTSGRVRGRQSYVFHQPGTRMSMHTRTTHTHTHTQHRMARVLIWVCAVFFARGFNAISEIQVEGQALLQQPASPPSELLNRGEDTGWYGENWDMNWNCDIQMQGKT